MELKFHIYKKKSEKNCHFCTFVELPKLYVAKVAQMHLVVLPYQNAAHFFVREGRRFKQP